jgi:hypothetical protein
VSDEALDNSEKGEQRARRPESAPPEKCLPVRGITVILVILVALLVVLFGNGAWGAKTIPYSEFKQRLAVGEVIERTLEPDLVVGTIRQEGDGGCSRITARSSNGSPRPCLFGRH